MGQDSLSVLLVEDDAVDALLVERSLEATPCVFELQVVDTLAAAVQQLQRVRPDIVLLDLSLPDSFGLNAVSHLFGRFPEVPLVVLTGVADNQLALQSLERGGQDYLVKGETTPFHLERTLRHAIQRHQIQRENLHLVTQLKRMANRDPLTGLLNRYAFNAQLEKQWDTSLANDAPLSCAVLDADFFKHVNDSYGHQAGDAVLVSIARTIESLAQPADSVVRYGGEEFCVLLPGKTESQAVVWAERARETIAAAVVSYEGTPIQVTASFGVAERMPETPSATNLLSRADEALQIAKQMGRNQVVAQGSLRSLASVRAVCGTQSLGAAFASDVMAPVLLRLSEGHSLGHAVDLLLGARLESVPVVDEQGTLMGLVTEEDLMARLLQSDAWESPVGECVNRKTITFAKTATVGEISDFLARAPVRRVVIVNEAEQPLGIVSRGVILRWLRNQLRHVARWDGNPQSLVDTIQQIVQQATDLRSRFSDQQAICGASLLAGVTRLQELLDESLGQVPDSDPGEFKGVASLLR